jgi:hypothetical protein
MSRLVTIKSPLIPFISSYNFPIKLKFNHISKHWLKKYHCSEPWLKVSINKNFYLQIYNLPEITELQKNNYQTMKGLIMLHNNKIVNYIEKCIEDEHNNGGDLFRYLNNYNDYIQGSEKSHFLEIFPLNLVQSGIFNVWINERYIITINYNEHKKFDLYLSNLSSKSEFHIQASKYQQLIPFAWYMNYDPSICRLISKKSINKLLSPNYFDTNFRFVFIFGIESFIFDSGNKTYLTLLLHDTINDFLEENNAKLLDSDITLLFDGLNISNNASTAYLRIFYYNDNTIFYCKDYPDSDFFREYPYSYLTVVVYSNEFLPKKILKIIKNSKITKALKDNIWIFNTATMNIEYQSNRRKNHEKQK